METFGTPTAATDALAGNLRDLASQPTPSADALNAEAHALLIKRLEQLAAQMPPITSETCDRCGVTAVKDRPAGKLVGIAQAFVRWIFPNGQTLTFCGHHAAEYSTSRPVLDGMVLVIDERAKINEKPSVSANKD